MGNKYGFWSIVFCFVILSPVGYAEERPINFKIYPWHIEIEVIGITDNAFGETFVGTGTSEWLRFSLPTGEYRYTARLDKYYDEHGTLSIPGPDENPLVFLTPKSQLATLLDASSNSFGSPLAFFVLLFSALALVVGAGWGVAWRRVGRWWCDSAAYRREERWKKNPSPTSQELAIKNGVALMVAVLLAATARFIILSREPNLNTLTYEQRMIIAPLLGIPLYNLVRFLALSSRTLYVTPSRYIWWRVNRQLTDKLGDVWRYQQPDPYNYQRLTVKSLKTGKTYRVATDYMRGKASKNTDTNEPFGSSIKFNKKLVVWYKELKEECKGTKLEAAFLFLPNATTDKFGDIRMEDNAFICGEVYIVCAALDDFVKQLVSLEKAKQSKISRQEYGVKVEKQAIQDLEKFKPKDWEVNSKGLLPYRGDIDAHIVPSEGRDIVIEIKSYRHKPRVRNGELVKPNGDFLGGDVEQAKKNAGCYGAKAVLWLPTADPFSFYFDGVLVFGGDALALYCELGAPSSQSASYSASVAP